MGQLWETNCVPYLMEIVRKKDVDIFLEHFMDIPSRYFEEGLVRKDGVILSELAYEDAYCDWTGYMYRLDNEWGSEMFDD